MVSTTVLLSVSPPLNEVIMLALHYYYRFKVSLDDVVELMAMHNLYLSHQTVHNWIQTFGVELGTRLRAKRKGKSGKKMACRCDLH